MDRTGIVVIGAGGHAKVIIESLQAMGRPVAYCISGEPEPAFCLDIPVLHGDHHIPKLRAAGWYQAFIAIGDNARRCAIAAKLQSLEFEWVNAIHPHAIVSPSVQLGQGLAIMAGVVINACTVIADFAIVNTGATIDHDCYIGCGAHIAPNCAVAGNVRVGDQAFIGIGSRIIPEQSIGAGAMVGAGAVVTSAIAERSLAVGVPAKVIRQLG